jgi:ankyrin repeat protein
MNTINYEEGLLMAFTIQFQDPESVRGLLAKGVSPNVTTNDQTSVLMLAALLPNSDICEALVKAGATVNVKNEDGVTPLHCAGTAKAAELLINAGADIETTDEKGNTPLHFAVMREVLPVVEILLRNGANCKTQNDIGTSPLEAALWQGGEMMKAFTDRLAEDKAAILTAELLQRLSKASS